MRKMFLFMMLSLDGYFEAPGHDIGWHNVDDEFNHFALEQLKEVDALMFGRRTYELMAGYWPEVIRMGGSARLDSC
jgi:dihydrofolate reductase